MIIIDNSPDKDNRNNYSELIEFEQIYLSYKQLTGLAAFISISLTTLLCIIFWPYIPHNTLIILYLSSILPLSIFPLVCGYLFRKTDPKIKQIKNWGRLLILIYFLRSSTWGLIGIIIYVPFSLTNHFALFFTLTIVTLFQIRMTSGYKPVFYVSTYPLLLPFTIRLLYDFTISSIALSFLTLFIFFLFTIFFNRIHKTFLDSTILGHEKTQLANDLEKANLDKSRFLAAASHDLRQPLHAQGLYLAELKKILTDTKASKIVQSLEKSTAAMRTMFDTLLDISRLDAGVIKPEIQHFPLSRIFDELYMDFSGMALDKGLAFRVVETSILIKSDPILLSRIIRNFVTNAIKYSDKGGILIGCRRRENSNVSIEIWDTGIGIAPEKLETIFQEFLQLDNSERDRAKGLGLGLAIVKRLALLLKHSISLNSRPGYGSIFSILVSRGLKEKLKTSRNTLSKNYTSDLNQLSVLIIDDDSAILEAMTWLLEDWGCIVQSAESTSDAIRLLDNNNFIPNIIIADYRLRDNKTGIDAIQILNSKFERVIPGILITGDTSIKRIEEVENSGHKVLHKPLAPDKLRSLLSYYKNTIELT